MVVRRIRGREHEALFDTRTTRQIEQIAATALPAHTLMARAGLSVARLAKALYPHARHIWIACGPGNNGGDGLIAATHLHQWAYESGGTCKVTVTHWMGSSSDESRLPVDARHALSRAREAGVVFDSAPPDQWDLAIDALLGIGLTRAPTDVLADWGALLHQSSSPTLNVDLPSGLDADAGKWLVESTPGAKPPARAAGPRHTLSLLTLKPGLFTADGRDACGEVWFDDLQVEAPERRLVTAWLAGRDDRGCANQLRPHACHKGSFGDVVVIGGQDLSFDGAGMTGAALLAARSALHGGAGRVYVGLLGGAEGVEEVRWDPMTPELMLRRVSALLSGDLLPKATVICGCGGGTSVASVLPRLLSNAWRLVLDADALNAVARDRELQELLYQRAAHGLFTVLTPHPLEAARLLDTTTATVMEDRLKSARLITEKFSVACVLKGSGTVITAPGQAPLINPTGNAMLATAGTGDVLAGLIGSAISNPGCVSDALVDRVARSVYQHGWLADQWTAPTDCLRVPTHLTLSAGRLADRVQPVA